MPYVELMNSIKEEHIKPILIGSDTEKQGNVDKQEPSDKNVSCKLCSFTCKSYSTLWAHKKTHSDERAYSCVLCEKSFKTPSSLNTHKKIHSDERPYNCEFCQS